MITYTVKRLFEAGSRPNNHRQYRPGDQLTQGDVDMWAPGELVAAMDNGSVGKAPAPVEPEPHPQPEPAPEPVHQS